MKTKVIRVATVLSAFVLVLGFQNCGSGLRVNDDSFSSRSLTFLLRDSISQSDKYTRSPLVKIELKLSAKYYCFSERPERPIGVDSVCVGGTGPENGWDVSVPTGLTLTSGDGAKTVRLWTAGDDRVASLSPEEATITLDSLKPSLSFSTPIPRYISSTDVKFDVTSSDLGAGVMSLLCRIDQGNFSACEGLTEFSGLAIGDHLVWVQALDHAGNEELTSYPVSVDQTAPTGQVNSGPSNPTNSTTASFAFFGIDDVSGVEGFECRLDAGAFANCVSPHNLNGLLQGPHSMTIRVRDRAGNMTTLSTFNWTIDLAAPSFSLTGPPAASNSNVANFSFAGAGIVQFTCQLDGGSISACTSPFQRTALSQGPHALRVTAQNAAGNMSSSTHSWVVDTVAPTVSLNYAQVSPSASRTAETGFNALDGGGTGITAYCQIDSGTPVPCTNPHRVTALADGSHSLTLYARDGAGNVSNTIVHTWIVDTKLDLMIDPPTSGVSASGEYPYPSGGLAFHAIDDDIQTSWNAGAFAPAWVQIDLGQTYPVSKIELQTLQAPTGAATHEILGGPTPGSLSPLGTLSGNYTDNVRLNLNLASPVDVRYIRVRTTASVSWVAWREIKVFRRTNSDSVHWPKYFTYFASSWDGYDSSAAIADHTNMAFIRISEVPKIINARNNGFTNLVVGNFYTFFCGVDLVDQGNCNQFVDPAAPQATLDLSGAPTDGIPDPGLVLRADYVAQWNAYWASIAAYAPYIKGITIVDEPFAHILTSALPVAEKQKRVVHLLNALERHVHPLIKATLPNVPIMVVFNTIEFDPATAAPVWDFPVTIPPNYTFRIPAGYDWVNVDCYKPWKKCYGRDVPYYINKLTSFMNPNQKLYLVPDASGYDKSGPLSEIDQTIKDRAEYYYAHALSNPRVVGVFPFLFQDLGTAFKGVQSFPMSHARYIQIGKSIRSNSY